MVKRVSKNQKIKKSKKIIPVKKISEKVQRISTGILGFDKMSSGGFEKDSINLIMGGTGSGKTIFGISFLMQGLLKKENVLYIAFEESKVEFYKNMKNAGFDLEKAEKTGKFTYLEYSPEKVKIMLDEGGGTIETLIYEKKVKRITLDSISGFSQLYESKSAKRQAIVSLFSLIRKWNITTLLTFQKDPINKKESSPEELQVDSSTLLYYFSVNGIRKRFIELLKMRGTNHSKETKEFIIAKGITIGKTKNIDKYKF